MNDHFIDQAQSTWTRQMIKKLKQIREMAWSYTWIHRENSTYLTDMYEWISVISYSLSFFNGIILIFPSNVVYIRILNILLSFGAGILVFYIKNKEFPQTAERHKIASSKFSNIYNNISRQLSLDVTYRDEAINYHRWITLQYENLYGTAPDIDPPIIEDYIRKFAGRRKFNPIEAAEFDQTNSTSNSDHHSETTISTNDEHYRNDEYDDRRNDAHDASGEESLETVSNGDIAIDQYSANTEHGNDDRHNVVQANNIGFVDTNTSLNDGHRDNALSSSDLKTLEALKLSMTPSRMEEGHSTIMIPSGDLRTSSTDLRTIGEVDEEEINNVKESKQKIVLPSLPLSSILKMREESLREADSKRSSVFPSSDRSSELPPDSRRSYTPNGSGRRQDMSNNNGYKSRRKNSHIVYEMNRMRHNNHEYMYGGGMDTGFMSSKCAIPEYELRQQEQIANNTPRFTTPRTNNSTPRTDRSVRQNKH
jgi:hypothetical protein